MLSVLLFPRLSHGVSFRRRATSWGSRIKCLSRLRQSPATTLQGSFSQRVQEPASLSKYRFQRVSHMSTATISDAAKAVVRRNTEEVQGRGNSDVFEELFADDFIDYTP